MDSQSQSRSQYEEKLEALHLHAKKLADAETIDEIEEYTVDAMENTLGLSWARLGIIEGNFNKFRPHNILGRVERIMQMPLDGPGISIRAINTGETQLVNDTRKDADYVGGEIDYEEWLKLDEDERKQRGPRTLSELDVPVKIGQTVVAHLGSESPELNAFTKQDQKLVETLASHVASAIQRIRLLEAQRQYEAKLEVLHQIANKLADAESIKEIAVYTEEALDNTVRPDLHGWGVLGIVEDNVVKFGLSPGMLYAEHPIDGPGIVVRTVRTGEAQIVNDTREDADYVGVWMNDDTLSRLDEWHRKLVLEQRERGETGSLSEIDVPVKIGDTVIGVIGGESPELNAFNEQDQKLLETLASHIASAIQRIRLLEAQLQYESKLEALHMHANKLAGAIDIEEIAEHTYDAVVNTLGFMKGYWGSESGPLGIVVDNNIEFTLLPNSAPDEPAWRRPIDGPGVTVRAVRTGETQLLNDVRLDDDHWGYYSNDVALSKLDEWQRKSVLERRESGDTSAAALSTLYVPVKIGDVVVGVLSIESLELNAFNEQDQKLVETLASHIASAIQRIRLLEAQRKYEEKLEALHQHANKLAEAKTVEEIAVYSNEALQNTVRPDLGGWGNLGIVKDNRLHWGLPPDQENYSFPLDGPGITVRTVRTGEVQIVNDVRKDGEYIGVNMDENTLSKLEEQYHERRARRRMFRPPGEGISLSEIRVPVKIGDSVIGVIGGESSKLNAFDEQDQKLLETLASHVASAIQRIRAKEEVKQLAYKLNGLKPGGSYLSESHDRCLKAYAVLSMEGVPGLCILRDDPKQIIENYGIKDDDIRLLSSRSFEDYETLADLQSVSLALNRFLESSEGVVLLDGLEYLISRFSFEAVYSFIQEKRFDFLSSKAVLLVPLEMNTLDLRQQALLSSEFTLLE